MWRYCAKMLATFYFRAEIGGVRERKKNWEQGEGLVKICHVKKRVGEGEERERALDGVFGIWAEGAHTLVE